MHPTRSRPRVRTAATIDGCGGGSCRRSSLPLAIVLANVIGACVRPSPTPSPRAGARPEPEPSPSPSPEPAALPSVDGPDAAGPPLRGDDPEGADLTGRWFADTDGDVVLLSWVEPDRLRAPAARLRGPATVRRGAALAAELVERHTGGGRGAGDPDRDRPTCRATDRTTPSFEGVGGSGVCGRWSRSTPPAPPDLRHALCDARIDPGPLEAPGS